jgi:hypothetical protein
VYRKDMRNPCSLERGMDRTAPRGHDPKTRGQPPVRLQQRPDALGIKRDGIREIEDNRATATDRPLETFAQRLVRPGDEFPTHGNREHAPDRIDRELEFDVRPPVQPWLLSGVLPAGAPEPPTRSALRRSWFGFALPPQVAYLPNRSANRPSRTGRTAGRNETIATAPHHAHSHDAQVGSPYRPWPATPLCGRVTVVIVTRNRATVLRRCLAELSALPESPRVVVVDDASTDATADVVRQFPDVVLVSRERWEGPVARNHGVERACTPYVAFNDDDSWWAAGALERAAELLDRNPALAVVTGRILVGDERRTDAICEEMASSPITGDPSVAGIPGVRDARHPSGASRGRLARGPRCARRTVTSGQRVPRFASSRRTRRRGAPSERADDPMSAHGSPSRSRR